MTSNQKSLILGLIIVSVLIFASSVIWYFIKIIRNKRTPEKYNKAGISTALVFSGFLILAIWCLRFAISYFAIAVHKDSIPILTVGEEIINCLFGALRTFSMEEAYAEYILNIKELISAIIPADAWYFSRCQIGVVVYASLLNLIAPVIGGAIILEILARIFPKIRLRLGYINILRKKYYFSELNAASLALAKSIYNDAGKWKKPALIFTDTYVDDEKEKEYELLLEAKQYGAICVRDDLLHVSKPIVGKREYYLIDENEFGNLQTLMGLINDSNVRYLKKSRIYLFVQSDAYVQIEKQINKELKEKKSKWFDDGKNPTIIPVNGYRNLVNNLFVDIPLFEPLIRKEKNATELNLTILGNGAIGTEAFLSAYWFGQMLISKGEKWQTMSECEMTINVVSKDSEDVFWSKIDYINPEIKETICVLGKETDIEESKLLVCDNAGNKNSPYCRVRYTQADVKIGGFWDTTAEESQGLLDSDYIIVALGNDADNISVAEKLRRLIGKKHLEEEKDCNVNNTIIAYVVFNSDLANTLNKQRHYQCRDKAKTDIYMYAFGSLEQVYSCDNVYMSKSKLWAKETGAAYNKISHIEDNQERNNNNYNYWANLARAMHVKYKVFSLGWIKKSVFDYLDESECKKHNDEVKEQCGEYKKIAVSYKPDAFEGDCKQKYLELDSKKHCLAWLEHRRWCAFTRTMGFQSTDAEKNIEHFDSHKNMPLKLHSCLVEARCPLTNGRGKYILADFGDDGKIAEETTFSDMNPNHHDRLDSVSFARKNKSPEERDFKISDYYRYEFD